MDFRGFSIKGMPEDELWRIWNVVVIFVKRKSKHTVYGDLIAWQEMKIDNTFNK